MRMRMVGKRERDVCAMDERAVSRVHRLDNRPRAK